MKKNRKEMEKSQGQRERERERERPFIDEQVNKYIGR